MIPTASAARRYALILRQRRRRSGRKDWKLGSRARCKHSGPLTKVIITVAAKLPDDVLHLRYLNHHLSQAALLTGRAWKFLWSSIVLLELMASASGESERKRLERLFRDYAKDNSLIVPDENDWALAGKVLFWLSQGRRRSAKGKTPRLKTGAPQRMALDALLAVSARRWRATVVTENWDDFKAIQSYCNVKVVRASEFFK